MESHVSREIIGLCERVDKWSTAYGASRTTEARFRFHHPLPVIYPHHRGSILFHSALATRSVFPDRACRRRRRSRRSRRSSTQTPRPATTRDRFSPPRDTTASSVRWCGVPLFLFLLFFLFLSFSSLPDQSKGGKTVYQPAFLLCDACKRILESWSMDRDALWSGPESDNLVNRVPALSRQRRRKEREKNVVRLYFFLALLDAY